MTVNNLNLEANKKSAIAFYKAAFEGNPKQAVADYVGNDYIQHNPVVAGGKAGFIEYFERMQAEYPNKSIEFKRCIAEGDLVALHTHQVWHYSDETVDEPSLDKSCTNKSNSDEYVTMDFFRFDSSGKIVEHWDSIQQIPDSSANGNSMY